MTRDPISLGELGPRRATEAVRVALDEARVVLVQGARQAS